MKLKFFDYLIFLFFLTAVNTALAQEKNLIPVEEVMELMEMESTTKYMVGQAVAAYSQQYPNIPEATWLEILDNIDYSSYLENVKYAFLYSYTEQELIELANQLKNGEEYIPKPDLEVQLFEIGKSFGQELSKQILSQLPN